MRWVCDLGGERSVRLIFRPSGVQTFSYACIDSNIRPPFSRVFCQLRSFVANHHYSCVILGPSQYRSDSIALIAHTSASSRSGEAPDDRPLTPKSHISSSSSGKQPTCFTLPCSY